MTEFQRREILVRALLILENVRRKPEMYFRRITPEAVENWLYGLQVGLGVAGIERSIDGLKAACLRRGVTLYPTTNLIDEFEGEGLSPHDVAMTLVDIDMEMWRSVLGDGAE